MYLHSTENVIFPVGRYSAFLIVQVIPSLSHQNRFFVTLELRSICVEEVVCSLVVNT